MAGMPVGPLSLNDEVAVDLAWKILKATEADLGADAIDPRQKTLLEEMVEKRGRLGRKNGKGFYDYPQNGPKRLWPGLADLQPTQARSRHDRRRGAQAAAARDPGARNRALRRGGRRSPTCARPMSARSSASAMRPFTGGTLSYIDMMGAQAFVELCRRLETSCGSRFAPSQLLIDMASRGDTFYGRFAGQRAAA